MSGDDSACTAQRAALQAKTPMWAVLLLVFCCWHAVFLIASLLPRDKEARERGNPAMDFYRLFVAGDQHWNMFSTIPQHHSLEPRIEVYDGKGGRTTLGSVMPGFAPYPDPEDARYYNVFFRILLDSEKSRLFHAYLRKIDALLAARHGNAIAGHWAMVVDVEWMRVLSEIRRNGVIHVPGTRSFDIANPGGISP